MTQLHQDTVDWTVHCNTLDRIVITQNKYVKTQQMGELNRDTVDGRLTLGHSRAESTLEHIRQNGYQTE